MQVNEREWFEVNPKAINRRNFRRKKSDKKQEETRKLILEAFEEVELNPEKYAKPFRIIIPEKTWIGINAEKSQELAYTIQGHLADWVEQALEWAQRIHNGESWKSICNEEDKSEYCRIIVWKDGNIRIVGGSKKTKYSMSDVCNHKFDFKVEFKNVIPLIVSEI